ASVVTLDNLPRCRRNPINVPRFGSMVLPARPGVSETPGLSGAHTTAFRRDASRNHSALSFGVRSRVSKSTAYVQDASANAMVAGTLRRFPCRRWREPVGFRQRRQTACRRRRAAEISWRFDRVLAGATAEGRHDAWKLLRDTLRLQV